MPIELTLLSQVAYCGREIVSPRLRGLLALLAGDLRAGVSVERLVGGLWPAEQPEHPGKALQVLVSRARAQLGAGVIATTPSGYRLALREDQVDAAAALHSAAASARCARDGEHLEALRHAEAGLALWEGAPGGAADAAFDPDDPVAVLRAERAPTYRALAHARALALARLGRHAEAVEPLATLAAGHPRDEEVLLELLRAEAATTGPAAALARYEAYRRSLRDELGADPGPALQALHQELLHGAAPAVRRGVAHEPNPLLGRDGDITAVTGLLRGTRVVSIVGPGGLGKTRLAQAVSRRAEQRVVYVVPLAGVSSDEGVAAAVSAALGAGEARGGPPGRPVPAGLAGRDLLAGIAAQLGPGPALLVLDNCEHVLGGAADLVSALVAMTPEVRVLTTSRAPLGLSSESVYPLPELDLPTSMELFRQRALAARPGVDLPGEAVAEVCRRLDGLPLAVELAAARVRVLSVAEIARRLEDRFALLRGGVWDLPERHQTLEAVVGWSWNLLDETGRAALRALSVFPAPFGVEAAGSALRDLHAAAVDAAPVLEDLAGQSLVQVVDTSAGTRFRMLETVREFAAARREAAGETGQAVGAFLRWARELGIARHEAPFGPDPYAEVAEIRAEQDNLVQALRHALANNDRATVAAVAGVLAALWVMESNYARLAALAGDTVELLSRLRPDPGLLEVTRTALTVFAAQGFVMQSRHAARSLAALRRLPPAPQDSLTGAVGAVLGAAARADRPAVQALCDSGQPLVAGVAAGVASYLAESTGDLDGALKAAKRTLEALDRSGVEVAWLRALARCRVAELCLQAEQGAEARRHLLAALPVLERLEAWSDAVAARWWLALASLQAAAVDEAEHWLEQAAPAWPAADEPVGTRTYRLGVRAEILLARGETEAGLRCWRQVVELLNSAEGPIFGIDLGSGEDPWVLEAKAVAVVAHARHGRLDVVDEVPGELAQRVRGLLAELAARPSPYVRGFPLVGALLLALGMAELDRGERAGEPAATRSGARLVALAERFRFLRLFQPTMASAAAREAAEAANRPAYHEAVSSYAGLGPEELRAAAVAALAARPTQDRP